MHVCVCAYIYIYINKNIFDFNLLHIIAYIHTCAHSRTYIYIFCKSILNKLFFNNKKNKIKKSKNEN